MGEEVSSKPDRIFRWETDLLLVGIFIMFILFMVNFFIVLNKDSHYLNIVLEWMGLYDDYEERYSIWVPLS